jgi:ATP synthase protein I|tara:strand:- start:106 stop:510 length:405 start_codon:yes stop_codon:yes gene_type:complete
VARPLKQNTGFGAPIVKPPLLKIYLGQCSVLAVLTAGLFFVDVTTAYSVLLGGMISILPNTYLGAMAFRHSGARAAQEVATSLYRGEVGKFVLTAVFFACIFVFIKPLSVGALFTTFIAMMVLNWFLVHRLSNF